MRRPLTIPLAFILACSTVSGAIAADPKPLSEGRARAAGLEKAAEVLGVRSDSLRAVEYGDPITDVAGTRYWTGLFDGDRGRQTFVAVDLATGAALDAEAYQARVDRDLDARPRITPPARERLQGARGTSAAPLLAYILEPPDYAPAVESVRARHPEVGWEGDRPIGDDIVALGKVSQELIRAKVDLLTAYRAPFVAAAEREGATDVVTLDLAPMVYARLPSARAERLSKEPLVRQVRAPSSWTPTMNTAHDAIGANYTDSHGYTGQGVIIGVVEYTRVDYGQPGLGGVRRDSYRVSSTGLSCPHSRGSYNNASAIRHVSWATAIAAGRGRTYKGIANAARVVDVSADANPRADAADPRILKAVDCAITQGGAHLITMSLVQNDRSSFSTSDAYFDAVVWDHHRLIVGNGGNNYSASNSNCPGSNERVQSPGSAWNVLTAGGASNSGTRLWYRADRSEPSFCWEDPPGHSGDVPDRVKPEIVAPAQNISTYFSNGSGVSAATPMVAGVAASILEQQPSLLNFPERMKAVLLAGTRAKRVLTPSGNESVSVGGLGLVSAKWSSRVAARDERLATGDFGGLTFKGDRQGDCYAPPEPESIRFPVGASNRKLRFVIDWMAHTGDANPRSTTNQSRRYADFNLTIRKGDTIIGSSNRSASNVEWVDFTAAAHGAGDYTAIITPVRWGCSISEEPVGWAWVSFATP
ncbi:MAG: S8 family serine peptidase [Candidatus Limnocylindrales bacterium]